MAADQRKKKRVNASSMVVCTSSEQYRVNRRKLQVQQRDLNMRPKISLEWDSKKKSVISKKEQIGIARRHLIPFVEPGPNSRQILADVVPVPQEIFAIENLSEVLSYEVWRNNLSDNERNFLSQLLPKELEPDTVVRELLSGDNFLFGNPLIKWSSSLCLGELHPDNVVHKEQSLKAMKKGYHSNLEKYHKDMIGDLQMWKGKLSNCQDLEVDILLNIWSSRKHVERSMPPYGAEENLVATPDSCSWANSEIAYSSENQNIGIVHGESQRRRDVSKKMPDGTSSGLKTLAAPPRKLEKLRKWNIQQNDGAKYMSYIKISREQHERVKSSMKNAGNSIQPRSLNNVLGSFDTLNVQPFARFEEEESKKLHDYWLKLATKDIPVAFANWKSRQMQMQKLTESLVEELGQKVDLQEITLDEAKEGSHNNVAELSDSEEEPLPSTPIKYAEEEQIHGLLEEQKGNEDTNQEMASEIEDEKDCVFEEREHDDTVMIEDDDGPGHIFILDQNEQQGSSLNSNHRSTMITSSSPRFLQDQHQQQMSSLNTNSIEMESHSDSGSAKLEDPPILSSLSRNINNIWPVSDVHTPYYQSTTPNAGYTSVGHPQFVQEAAKNMLHRQTVAEELPFFTSCSTQAPNELLHSLFKGPNNLSYHQPQRHPTLDFQPASDLVMEAPQFPFREHINPSLPLDLRQKSLYLHQNVHDSIYSGGMPLNVNDWSTVNNLRMPAPHLNSGEMSQQWYENGNRDGWAPLEPVGVNHSLNSGSRSDQTLFSVISECSELPRMSYDAVGSVQAGNYGGIDGGIASSSNFLQQAPNPLNYLSGHEASSGSKINNLAWIGSGLPESIGKPFLRSWNQ